MTELNMKKNMKKNIYKNSYFAVRSIQPILFIHYFLHMGLSFCSFHWNVGYLILCNVILLYLSLDSIECKNTNNFATC